jgi:tetratricopeptide (TPR) repeat protein
MSRAALRVLWPFAILAIFAGAFRRSAADRDHADAAAPCHVRGRDAPPLGVEQLERCIADYPHDVDAMIDLAAAYERGRRPGDAEALYRRALAVEPRDSRIHVRLGRLRLAAGDAAAARSEGEAALRFHVGNADAMQLVREAQPR